MTLFDKVVAAVTPPETDQQRHEARARAQAAAGAGDWLALVLQHHEQLEAAFTAVRNGADAAARRSAQQALALLLTGHSSAEESVLYPALVRIGQRTHATMGYTEQAGAKIKMGELEYLDPMSQDYLDKLEHICGAVRHHMYEEESSRFIDLKRQMPAAEQAMLTARFKEEFERYTAQDRVWAGAPESAAMESGARASVASMPRPH
jgi:hypothetical protein